jgi:peptidoglycan hydrolase-like protein with peptidoglycan-binding domain
MTAWRGIIGKSFTPDAFEKYVGALKFGLWRPQFVVVHNTSAPDLKTWNGWQARNPPVTDEKWAQNLVGYYRDQEHWAAGPHLFITPNGILAFSPLTGPGTHSPAWNSITWGVETVGEFEHEPFAGAVRTNLIAALAILHASAGLQPMPYQRGVRGLHFHKEDPITTHKSCPGRNMVKADLVAAVQGEILRRHGGGHVHPMTLMGDADEAMPDEDAPPETEQMAADEEVAQDPPAIAPPDVVKYDLAIEILQRKLVGLNYHEIGDADGLWGGKTRGAVTAFMNDRGKSPDGLTNDSGFTSPAASTVVSNEINGAIAENWSRPIAASRANATAKDIAPKVEAVRQSLWQRFWAKVGAGFAAIGLTGSSLSSTFDSVRDKLETVHGYLAKVPPEIWFVTIGLVAALVWYSASKAASSSVKDFNTGRLN